MYKFIKKKKKKKKKKILFKVEQHGKYNTSEFAITSNSHTIFTTKYTNNIASLHGQQEGVLSEELKFSENSAPCNSLCTCNTCRRIW